MKMKPMGGFDLWLFHGTDAFRIVMMVFTYFTSMPVRFLGIQDGSCGGIGKFVCL